jgi:SAM-dependent methyltransferase
MDRIPDFHDLRYLNEVGWFLYREKYGYNHFTDSYAKERMVWSEMLLDDIVGLCSRDRSWVEDKRVVTIGCGCTGDLAAWPAAVKIAVDPLLSAYQELGMLIEDAPNTQPTVFLSAGVQDLPLLNDCADIVICRNALDHMPNPKQGLDQIWRILNPSGIFFLSVDIGGAPTPDEPSPFTRESLSLLLEQQFDTFVVRDRQAPHNEWRDASVTILARKKGYAPCRLRKEEILQAYESEITRSSAVEHQPTVSRKS